MLCSLADRATALAELHRVLRGGSPSSFLEHGRGDTGALRAVQRLADATVWPLLAGGCRLATGPVGDVAAGGQEEVRAAPDVVPVCPVVGHLRNDLDRMRGTAYQRATRGLFGGSSRSPSATT